MPHAYLRGLLGPGSGKSLHGIAKRMGLGDDRIERFVRESPWEYAAVQDHLVARTPEEVRSPRAALIVDDVALVKKGRMSVAAYRQWCGATGTSCGQGSRSSRPWASPPKGAAPADRRTSRT